MSLAPPPHSPPRPGLGLLKRAALGCLAIFVLAAAGTATAGLLEVKSVVDIIKTGHKIKGIESVLDDVDGGGPQTILVLGSDHRWIDGTTNPPRSDTLMLIRLDPSKGATAVMSLPRDLEVQIPGHCGPCKLNAAYAYGGPKLTVQVIKGLFGGSFPINHVVNVNFDGFARAINYLGCFYVDVDRRYFHSNKGVPIGARWAAINIQPGYQRLCGNDSLAFVRYRHTDNDEVRAARQQWYLRAAKDQLPLGDLLSSHEQLLRIFARYTDTDVRDTDATLKLIKLAIESAGHPVRTIHLAENFTTDGQFVTISQGNLRDARERFLEARAGGPPQAEPHGSTTTTSSRSHAHSRSKRHKTKRESSLAKGLVAAGTTSENYVADAASRTPFPLYYPRAVYGMGGFVSDPPRVYGIRDDEGVLHHAYRLVLSAGEVGQYYGIQGMTWMDPPVLDHPSETRSVDGRRFELFYDADRLRIVAWRTTHAVYWVSNTLSETLSNGQMLGIARSLAHIS
ncbi:MAG TPA: LCP family protein [Solirubrobacteraceae bacterium]|nr:LCP family protein [Solirubrobacteraceae bacterium]